MNFKELLTGYMKEKTRIIVNGVFGTEKKKATIIAVHDDFIEVELLEIEKEVKSGKERTTREVICMPMTGIVTVSKGEETSEASTGLAAFVEPGDKK
jgi:hypothetical protein